MKHSLSILLALAAALTVSLSGCSGSSTSADASFSDSDLILNIGGDSYTCAVGIDTVTGALGEAYEYAEGLSCAYDGLDKTFTYEEATFYTNPMERGDTVSEIYTESADVTTSKGITVGATKDEVLAAYGDSAEDAGNMLIYRGDGQMGTAEGAALCFEMQGDTVAAIFLTLEAI